MGRVALYIAGIAVTETGTLARIVQLTLVGIPALVATVTAAMGIDFIVPSHWWGVLAFVAVLGSLLFNVSKRAIALEEERVPRLRLHLDPEHVVRSEDEVGLSDRFYCVRLTNDGAQTIRHVIADIESVEDCPTPAFPARLRLFRINTDNIHLNSHQPADVCIAKVSRTYPGDSQKIIFCCHNPHTCGDFPVEDFKDGKIVTVSAWGDESAKATIRLKITSDSGSGLYWSLRLEQV